MANVETPKEKLWSFFAQEHNLTLLDSEMHDIVLEVAAYLQTEENRLALINNYTLPFHAVRYPEGDVDHCTLRMDAKDAIEEFMDTERALNIIANAGRIERGKKPRCAKSWEQYEAEGYSVVPVRIFEVKP